MSGAMIRLNSDENIPDDYSLAVDSDGKTYNVSNMMDHHKIAEMSVDFLMQGINITEVKMSKNTLKAYNDALDKKSRILILDDKGNICKSNCDRVWL